MSLLSAPKLRLTVVICTHNRTHVLAPCLSALMAGPARPDCEFLLIDSGSSDAERRIMERLVQRFPQITLRRVDEPGLSRARNAGVSLSSGEWIAFLDDDTVPAEDWLERACDLIAAVPPTCALIGGAVLPLPATGTIAQLPPRWRQLLSIIESDGEGDRTHAPAVCGANILLRKAPLLEIGGFPEQLGRFGTRLQSGEEKFVEQTLILKGWRVWYSDRLRVDHRVSADRLKWRWITSRAYWEGSSDVIIMRLLGRPLGMFRLTKVCLGLVIHGLLSALPPWRGERALRVWYNMGWLGECIGGTRTRAQPHR